MICRVSELESFSAIGIIGVPYYPSGIGVKEYDVLYGSMGWKEWTEFLPGFSGIRGPKQMLVKQNPSGGGVQQIELPELYWLCFPGLDKPYWINFEIQDSDRYGKHKFGQLSD
jgi:hypothetical protein